MNTLTHWVQYLLDAPDSGIYIMIWATIAVGVIILFVYSIIGDNK